jgi:type II secretory pathway pseudopilin PulG
MPRCKAKTQLGDQCKNNAIQGTPHCYLSAHGGNQSALLTRALNLFVNQKVLAIVGIVGTFVTIFSLGVYFRDKQLQATSGVLSGTGTAEQRLVLLGGIPISFNSADGVILRDGQEPLLRVRLIDGKLYVNAKIRNERGELIAELDDNQWSHQVRPAIFDRNYNDHLLEIIGSDGNVVLQVVDFGRAIYVGGLFRCRNAWSTVIGPASNGAALLDIRPPGKAHIYEIPRICEYSSDRRLGSCPGIASMKVPPAGDQSIRPLPTGLDLCPAH